ncbi:CopG family transcriptional regulator [Aeromicrobium sp. A1-2]|uniref:CopG family transcriptional regulator n=1 Tax=Aeromicrobium sp. A1-2 TaxID=2107713 RepID=UPI000E48E374|nr:CopG family transcriptional regulator [Aeromicrobium sp. A1-2]AXT85146.1 CopG family transcriptional regulator [Aeromicrobium sp. A1-2]
MRSTVNFDDDVIAVVERLRALEQLGFSEAVNRLARAGASVVGADVERPAFVQPTVDLGQMTDVSNVAEALELAEANDDR